MCGRQAAAKSFLAMPDIAEIDTDSRITTA
jgi:hypothetical protein